MSQSHANPFPGLRPFRTEEHHLFFGREEQTAALLELLREQRFLAVVGASGSGKSSLVRAGLIPALHRGTMARAGSAWEVVVLRPGGNPLSSLARALIDAELYDAADRDALPRVRATLTRSLYGLVEAVRQSSVLDGETNVLVVVDQFEELFRFRERGIESEEAAGAFVNLLLTASAQDSPRIYVTITMRSDYLGDCAQIGGLAEAINRGEYLIPRLSRDQRRDAVEKPVGVGGARIAPRLVQHMLNELGDDPDQLPVLQHALMRTWEAWRADHADGEPLDLPHYEATGGVAEALSRHADEVWIELGEARADVCARVFKALTVKGADNRGIRRPTRLGRLARICDASEEDVTAVVESFRRPGVTFLMPGANTTLSADTVVDLSHESLMRAWRRLRGWVEEEAQSARIYRRLAESAALWMKGEAGLYHDPDLQIARTWRDASRPTADWAEQYGGGFERAEEFLDRSREAAEKGEHEREAARRRELDQARRLAEAERRRVVIEQRARKRLGVVVAILAVLGVVAVIALLAALEARRTASENALLAEANAALARRNEEAASAAAAELQRTVVASDFTRGVDAIEAGNTAAGLGSLARAMRTDPSFWPAGMRALSTLTAGRFPLHSFDRIEQEHAITSYLYNAKEDLVFTTDAADDVDGPQRFVWDARTGERLWEVAPGERLKSAAWSEDGAWLFALVVGSKSIHGWEARTGKGIGPPIVAADVDRFHVVDGAAGPVVVVRYEDWALQVWRAATAEAVTPRLTSDAPASWGFGLTPYGRIWGLHSDGTISVRDTQGVVEAEFSTRPYQPVRGNAIALNPNGQAIFYQAADGKHFNWWTLPAGDGDRGAARDDTPEWIELTDESDGRFLPGGNRIVLINHVRPDRPAILRAVVYDLATRERVAAIESPRPVLRDFHPDEPDAPVLRFSLLGSIEANVARVWDLETGLVIREIVAPSLLVDAQFSPEGRRVATVSSSREVMLWDLFSGAALLPEAIEHKGDVELFFSPDGEKLITHDAGKRTLQVFDSRTGQRLVEPIEQLDFRGQHFPLAGRRLLLWEYTGTVVGAEFQRQTGGTLRLLDIDPRPALFEPLFDASGLTADAKYTPDGASIVVAGRRGAAEPEQLFVFDAATRRQRLAVSLPREAFFYERSLQIAPDSAHAVAGCSDGRARVFDLATGDVVHELAHGRPVVAAAVSPDGSRVATGTDRGSVRIWDLATGAPITSPLDHGALWINDLEFSPDGTLFASASRDQVLRVADARTGAPRLEPLKTDDLLIEVAFSPDGEHLAAVSFAQTVPIIEVASGRVVRRLTHLDRCRRAAFSPDGRLLAVGGGQSLMAAVGEITLWDWRAGTTVSRPIEAGGAVDGLTFSTDGKLLASGTIQDGRGTVQVWDVASGRSLIDPVVNRAAVSSVGFDATAGAVLATCRDGAVRVIELPPRGDTTPSWLPRLAESTAGQRPNAGGGVEDVPRAALDAVRAELAATAENDLDPTSQAYSRWARWFFADAETRPSAPGSTVTFREYIARLRHSTRVEDLEEAMRLAPQDALGYARVGLALLVGLTFRNALDQRPDVDASLRRHWRASADWYSRRATEIAPRDPEVWALRAEALERIGETAAARVAAATAIELDRSSGERSRANASYVEAIALAGEGRWDEADAAFAATLEQVGARRVDERGEMLLGGLPALVPTRAPPGFRELHLPEPISGAFEDFDSVPEGRLPDGWMASRSSTRPRASTLESATARRLDRTASDTFDDWTVVSAARVMRFTDGSFSAERALTPGARELVDGTLAIPLLSGRFVYALSDARPWHELKALVTPDFDLSGRKDVHVAFRSAYEQNQNSLGAVEYSIDGGASWLPVVYLLDATRMERGGGGDVDAVATFDKTHDDLPWWLGEDGRFHGGTFGAYVSVPIDAALDGFLDGRRDDDTRESKRVEVFRLPAADGQSRVRLRFALAAHNAWYWGIDEIGLYEIAPERLAGATQELSFGEQPVALAALGVAALSGAGLERFFADMLAPRELAAAGRPLARTTREPRQEAPRARPFEARLLVRRALALAPENPWVLALAARAFAELGDADEAFAVATRLLELEPDSALWSGPLASVATEMGDALHATGDLAGATVAYELAHILHVAFTGTVTGELRERLAAVGLVAPSKLLVERGAEWSYFDRGALPAGASPGWTELEFDHGTWSRGRARLGYSDGARTVVGYGPNAQQKHVTTYFRTSFDVVDLNWIAQLKLSVQRDDGVVVYLNGEEVLRDNMPDGPLDASTLASRTVADLDETRFFEFDHDAAPLRPGRNVVAAELHQVQADSSDLGFDLELEALGGLREAERPVDKIAALEERLGIPEPLRCVLWVSRAQSLRKAGKLERAAAALERGALLGLADPMLDFERAMLLEARGETDAAYETYLVAARGALGLKAAPPGPFGHFLSGALKSLEPFVEPTAVGLASLATDRAVRNTTESHWLLRWSEALDAGGHAARLARGDAIFALGRAGEALALADAALAAGAPAPSAPRRAVREHKEWLGLRERCLRRLGRIQEADETRAELFAIPPRDPTIDAAHIDLTPFYNASLYGDRDWHEGTHPTPFIAETFRPRHGVEFDIRGIIQLDSGVYPPKAEARVRGQKLSGFESRPYPDAVTGIPVGREIRALHFLTAALYAFVGPDGAVARFVVHYEDGGASERPVVRPADVVDWAATGASRLPRERVAWIGGEPLRLLSMVTWTNPEPERRVRSVDFVSEKVSAAPFLVAITAE